MYHVTVACFPPKPSIRYLICFQEVLFNCGQYAQGNPPESRDRCSEMNRKLKESGLTRDLRRMMPEARAENRKPKAGSPLYSYLSASIGCIREAFRAGKNPDTIPTIERIVNEMIITPIDACRKIAPSWSVVL